MADEATFNITLIFNLTIADFFFMLLEIYKTIYALFWLIEQNLIIYDERH